MHAFAGVPCMRTCACTCTFPPIAELIGFVQKRMRTIFIQFSLKSQMFVAVSAFTREEHTAHWSKRRFSAPNCQYVNEHSARQVCWTCQSGASNTHSESTHTLLVSKPTYVCVFRREKLLPPLSLWFVCFKRMVRVSNSLLVTNVRAFRRRDY